MLLLLGCMQDRAAEHLVNDPLGAVLAVDGQKPEAAKRDSDDGRVVRLEKRRQVKYCAVAADADDQVDVGRPNAVLLLMMIRCNVIGNVSSTCAALDGCYVSGLGSPNRRTLAFGSQCQWCETGRPGLVVLTCTQQRSGTQFRMMSTQNTSTRGLLAGTANAKD